MPKQTKINGSEPLFAEKVARSLEQLIKTLGIRNVLDCGEFLATDFDTHSMVLGKAQDILQDI